MTTTDDLGNFKYLNDEQLYKIYDDGRVFSVKRNVLLQPTHDKTSNHMCVHVVENAKNKTHALHALMYKVFHGPFGAKFYVTHVDEDFRNNHIDNLQLVQRNKAKNPDEFDEENWKSIAGYEGRYIASKTGEIKSLFSNKAMKDNANTSESNTCKKITLVNAEGIRKTFYAHLLIYTTFVEKPPNTSIIEHINGIKTDNRLENLRAVTRSNRPTASARVASESSPVTCQSDHFVNLSTRYLNLDFSNYEINEYGQIRNTVSGQLLTPEMRAQSYLHYLTDAQTGHRHSIGTHRLVAAIYIENPNKSVIVCHIDNNKLNNHHTNLQWVDATSVNVLTLGKKIGQYSLTDELIKEFACIADAVRSLGKSNGSESNIASVCKGKRTSAFGFHWKWH